MAPTFLMILVIVAAVIFLYNDHQKELRMKEEEEEHKAQEEQKQKEHEQYMASMALLMRKTEAMLQAEMAGATEAHQALIDNTYDGPLPERDGEMYNSVFEGLMIIPIAGINYRTGIKNYIGDFKGVLVPEPKNDYDPNAIMVKCEDGHHLGYVPEDTTAEVRRLIGQDFKRHRIIGHIYQHEEDDFDDKTRYYYTGHIYVGINPQ